MDKITKLPDKPQKHPTRFVILPLKPHLAKFLLFTGWDKLHHDDPGYDYAFQLVFKAENFLNNPVFIDYFSRLLCEQVSKNTNPVASVSMCRSKKNLPEEIDYFRLRGHTLV